MVEDIVQIKTHFSRKETASYLDATVRHTYNLEGAGLLKSVKVLGKTYFPREQVEGLFKQPIAKAKE